MENLPISLNELFAVLGIVFIVVLLIVLFFIPGEGGPSRFRKRRRDQKEQHKDWRAVSLRLEKHIYRLRRDIETEKGRGKQLERELLIQKEKCKQLDNKLGQERGWQQKEKEDAEKKGRENIELQKNLKKAEQHLAQEHGARLKRERELKELQRTLDESVERQRTLEVRLAKFKASQEHHLKELASLKAENAQLKKKHEEATFVAKSEYERIEKQLKQRDKELEDFKHRIQREMR